MSLGSVQPASTFNATPGGTPKPGSWLPSGPTSVTAREPVKSTRSCRALPSHSSFAAVPVRAASCAAAARRPSSAAESMAPSSSCFSMMSVRWVALSMASPCAQKMAVMLRQAAPTIPATNARSPPRDRAAIVPVTSASGAPAASRTSAIGVPTRSRASTRG